ncbi:MAG: hypothetical protein HPY75_14980 [Actinobacteria bacterium]|nr:hypothetical protein [Actinomycetota bacterium]
MEFLGYQYSPRLEELHNTLADLLGDDIRVEDIRFDEDERLHTALGAHKRNPDGTISIKFNPERPEEADIAHEYLHGIFQAEGYPTVRYFGIENRNIDWLRTHIDDAVIHPLIFTRSEELGFSMGKQRERILSGYIESLSEYAPENTSNVVQMQIRAFQMLFAFQQDKNCEDEIRRATRANLPITFSIFQEYKSIVPREGTANKRKCQKCLLRLIEICDSQFNEYGNEDTHLRERLFSVPVYISMRDANKPARTLVTIQTMDRITDGVQWFCFSYTEIP